MVTDLFSTCGLAMTSPIAVSTAGEPTVSPASPNGPYQPFAGLIPNSMMGLVLLTSRYGVSFRQPPRATMPGRIQKRNNFFKDIYKMILWFSPEDWCVEIGQCLILCIDV